MKPTTLGKSSDRTKSHRTYREVHLNTLRLNTVLDFALYTKIHGEFIVYRREKLPFTTTQKQALLENNLERLYILSDQAEIYDEYLRDSVSRIADDSQADLTQRAAAFYRTTQELARQFIEYPASVENLSVAVNLVKGHIRFLGEGRNRLHALMAEMEENASLHTHCLNVTIYGLALAQHSGLTEAEELDAIGIGLMVQDIGMLRIPEPLLFKPGPLSFDEWSLVKRHPALGLEAVEQLPDFPDIAKGIIFGHHERIDGSGYPQGLRGREVSPYQRLAGIADVFASLTVSRPYREAYSSFEALRIIQGEMYEQFDPRMVGAFIKVLGV